jgi:UDP-N-acetylmuramoyl-L-alanyl-D-glutamate--2,6-diaminopimelate ligase
MRGRTHDGHQFIDAVLDQGAAVIVAEGAPTNAQQKKLSEQQGWIQVASTRAILGPLAQALAGWPARKLTMIGVTGTNGKTTVATLIYQALTELDIKTGLLSTVRKYIGTKTVDSTLTTADPVELASDLKAMVDADCTHAVMEVSSHALDQQRVAGLNFDIGIFTNLSHDHLDYHESMEAYQQAKARLFRQVDPEGTALLNLDDDASVPMIADCPAKVIGYGQQAGLSADYQFIITQNSAQGVSLTIDNQQIESPLIGAFNAYNLAAAYLALTHCNISGSKAAHALSECVGPEGRLERVQLDNPIPHQPGIFVDYAHTPDALLNVLRTLSETKSSEQELHVVFGCGGDRDRGKRPQMAIIAEEYADAIWVTSDNPRTEDPDAIIDEIMTGFTDPESDRIHRITLRDEAIQAAISQASDQSIILIAGKGHETYQEINGERTHFDDREVARQALNKRTPHQTNGEVN